MSLFNPYSYQRLIDLREAELNQKMKRRQQLHLDRAEKIAAPASAGGSPAGAQESPGQYRPSERPASPNALAGRSISSPEL